MDLWPDDWSAILLPQASLLELVFRGTVIYLLLFVALRVLSRRQLGRLAVADILLLFLLASSVRLGLTGHDPSLISAVVVAATLFFWDWVIDWSAFRFQSLRWLLRKHPLPLVEDGRFVERTVRRELLTEEDLAGMLRDVGVTSVDEVRHATLEADGSVSVAVRGDDGEGEG